ncbi:MAG: Tetraacyldisaccharide 4-kinase [Gemmatimonadetes bacterium]|nr:Tetraacyldisaccharide 4-kinase [Gemmatimonadota bacterium]
MSVVERLWYDDGSPARVARALLAPARWAYASVTALRGTLYDRGVLRAHVPPIPVLSLGNITVGGTGKTPVAAWAAARLHALGARPAIVLRGYGEDEPLVHARLNPDIPVIADANRVRGVRHARDRGADCAVLDDAFQHRRIARQADWVLIAAEQWRDSGRLLPVGPLREPIESLARATLVIVTRKSASLDRADEVAAALRPHVTGGATAVMHLAQTTVVNAISRVEEPLATLRGRRIVAVAAIGAPGAFFEQLRVHGRDTTEMALRDHHHFTDADVHRILRLAEGRDGVVCTLKDAVKLAPLWPPAAAPLWYVSQAAVVERGRALLDASLGVILAARAHPLPSAGPAGPSVSAHGHRPSTADQ